MFLVKSSTKLFFFLINFFLSILKQRKNWICHCIASMSHSVPFGQYWSGFGRWSTYGPGSRTMTLSWFLSLMAHKLCVELEYESDWLSPFVRAIGINNLFVFTLSAHALDRHSNRESVTTRLYACVHAYCWGGKQVRRRTGSTLALNQLFVACTWLA